MQNNFLNERDSSFSVNTISRSSNIHHINSSSSSGSIPPPAASASVSPERRKVLQRENSLDNQALGELQWWIVKLKHFNGRYLIPAKHQVIIQTDASLEGWGANCMCMETEGKWSVEKRKLHINILELLAVKNAILAFTKEKTINEIHIQTDNTAALSCLLKMGGTTDRTIKDLSKDICKYLILKQITITAECLPGILNTRADWNLSPIVF